MANTAKGPNSGVLYAYIDTAANLASDNPVLGLGQTGKESDTGYVKIGNGTTAWNQLKYVSGTLSDASVYAATILSPSAAGTYVIARVTTAHTVTGLRAYVNGSTGSTINFVRRRSGSNVDLLSADYTISSADAWQDASGNLQNSSLAAGDALLIAVRSVSGTPTQIGFQIEVQ